MGMGSTKEQAALAQVMRADQEEQNRAFWWRMLPVVDRATALELARMDKRRAVDNLEAFTIQERERIHTAVTSHVMRLNVILHCTGILVERRPVVNEAAVMSRTLELEQQQAANEARRAKFRQLQEQEQEQVRKGRLH
jgi:hypothetical protein